MDFAPIYLIHRFFFRIFEFFRHWYLGGSRSFAHAFISTLEGFDRTFAVKVTLTHFFEPLYKDYSFPGRIFGIVFRAARVAVGLVVYLACALIALISYLIWLAVPIFVLAYAIIHLR